MALERTVLNDDIVARILYQAEQKMLLTGGWT